METSAPYVMSFITAFPMRGYQFLPASLSFPLDHFLFTGGKRDFVSHHKTIFPPQLQLFPKQNLHTRGCERSADSTRLPDVRGPRRSDRSGRIGGAGMKRSLMESGQVSGGTFLSLSLAGQSSKKLYSTAVSAQSLRGMDGNVPM